MNFISTGFTISQTNDATGAFLETQGGLDFNQVTVTAEAVAPGVPEPAEWAMLLVGFFGLGTVVRRVPRSAYGFSNF